MYVPCDTCRDRNRCYRFNSMNRDAIMAFVAGTIVECNEHRDQEVPFDARINLDNSRRGFNRLPGRVLYSKPSVFLGTR